MPSYTDIVRLLIENGADVRGTTFGYPGNPEEAAKGALDFKHWRALDLILNEVSREEGLEALGVKNREELRSISEKALEVFDGVQSQREARAIESEMSEPIVEKLESGRRKKSL